MAPRSSIAASKLDYRIYKELIKIRNNVIHEGLKLPNNVISIFTTCTNKMRNNENINSILQTNLTAQEDYHLHRLSIPIHQPIVVKGRGKKRKSKKRKSKKRKSKKRKSKKRKSKK